MQSLRLILVLLFFVATPSSQAAVFSLSNILTSHIMLVQVAVPNEDEAAKSVRAKTGGRVLNVESAQKAGRVVYLVKVLLPSGTVRVVEVHGQ